MSAARDLVHAALTRARVTGKAPKRINIGDHLVYELPRHRARGECSCARCARGPTLRELAETYYAAKVAGNELARMCALSEITHVTAGSGWRVRLPDGEEVP